MAEYRRMSVEHLRRAADRLLALSPVQKVMDIILDLTQELGIVALIKSIPIVINGIPSTFAVPNPLTLVVGQALDLNQFLAPGTPTVAQGGKWSLDSTDTATPAGLTLTAAGVLQGSATFANWTNVVFDYNF